MSKCAMCNEKAAVKVKLGTSKDKRNLCMKHYNHYMNCNKDYKANFTKASNL
jgi:hypothetical protein